MFFFKLFKEIYIMTNVSANVIQSMFNHLSASYSADEAKDILVQKYPESETLIKEFKVDGLRTTVVEMGKVKSVTEAGSTVATDLKTAVKTKVAKPKTESAPKKESKVDLARAMYNQSENKTRAVVVAMFMEKLGMSKAMASTYFYSCRA
jgi:hypothetical protein